MVLAGYYYVHREADTNIIINDQYIDYRNFPYLVTAEQDGRDRAVSSSPVSTGCFAGG